MTGRGSSAPVSSRDFANGGAAAALVAAGVGSVLVSVFAILGDQSAFFKNLFIFYRPTGPLSGVTSCAIVVWLVVWFILHRAWRERNLNTGRVGAVAVIFLVLGLLLSFPPIADLF
jgi:hypothetical protein